METWKNIHGFEKLYQISNLGRVKRLERIKLNSRNGTPFLMPEGIMNLRDDKKGYKDVKLSDSNKNQVVFPVHRLVAIHFIPNPSNKPNVNHINGIRDDNRVENLEWCTQKENIAKSIFLGKQNTISYCQSIIERINNSELKSVDDIKEELENKIEFLNSINYKNG